VALRESAVRDDEYRDLLQRLQRLDARSPDGPWTRRTLSVIRSHPELRAGDLCALVGQDKARFKLNVRKLKGLGLTESLETGYRLSTRGIAFMRSFRDQR
jgi:hypothetical protein